MAENVYDTLKERGFIAQMTNDDELRAALAGPPVTFYIGFDSTAASLHAGSLVPIMAMMHLQQAGHLPIVVVGGGIVGAATAFFISKRHKNVTLIEREVRNLEI